MNGEQLAEVRGMKSEPAIPYVEIRLDLEGRVTGWIRRCGADEAVAARVRDWVAADDDRAEIVEAFRRLRDRQAA